MSIHRFIITVIASCFLLCGIAQEPVKLGGYKFIENKNQWPEQVKYRSDIQSGFLYLEKDGFLFDLYDAKAVNKLIKAHTTKAVNNLDKIKYHSYKVQFLGCNEELTPKGSYQSLEYYNYFLGNDQDKWGSKANAFHRIEYKNLYDGIDVQLYSKIFNLKYDFIVAPHADPNQIQVKYEGADQVSIKNERLHIYTSVNHIIEDKPYAFQVINDEKVEVKCRYNLENNVLTYSFPDGYNKEYELIIDPTLMFSTYSGSFSNNFGYTATFDSKGFLYSGSSAFGTQYPTTLGAYDDSFNGGDGLGPGVDIAISKFDTSGTFLIYSTYIGGISDELPHSLIVNSFDELFILGSTSSPDFPYTTNCFDSTFNGGTPNDLQNGLGVLYANGSDIIASHLSTDGGTLLGSTYIGGSQNDGLNSTSSDPTLNKLRYNYADEVRGEIDIDKNNNIYIASCTRSDDFPIVGNVFQPTYGGGEIDACVIKMDNALQNIIWSSYLGGEDHDAAYSLALDSSDNIYLTGGSASTTFPTMNSSYSPNFNGGRADGFVTHINKNGEQIINSTFYGSSLYDQSYFVELDNDNNVYLLGQTEITDNTFIKSALWNIPGSGQFISKITPELDSVLYSTVFGNGNGISISPTAFLVDLCNKIYLAGWGGGVNNIGSLYNNAGFTTNMPITADAFQNTTDGSDFYLMVMEDDASAISYGSYFGGPSSSEHVDGGTSRFDRKGKIYQAVCASCDYSGPIGNQDFPIYPSDAASTSNNSNCNLGVFKMDFDLPSVIADFETPPVNCAPYTHDFTNTSLSQLFTNFYWDFGDGVGTSTVENPSYTYNSPGTYTVSLILEDTSTCNFGDTITKDILILGNTSSTAETLTYCNETIEQIGLLPSADPGISYLWSPGTYLSDSTVSNPFVTATSSINYMLLISNGNCVDTLFQPVNVVVPSLSVPADSISCEESLTLDITANSMGTASNFVWSSTIDFLDTLNTPNNSSFTATVNSSSWFFVEANHGNCNSIDSVLIQISPVNVSLLSDDTICKNDTVALSISNNNPQDILTYDWEPDNDIINGDGTSSITTSPLSLTDYSVIISNSFCEDTLYSSIEIDSILLTVPTDTVFCSNSATMTLAANTFGTSNNYVWSSNELFTDTLNSPISSNSIFINPTTNTTYYVEATNSGCRIVDSVIIGFANAQTTVVSNQLICIGDTTTLEVTNVLPFDTLTYDWEVDELIIEGDGTNTILVAPDSTTTYYVTSVNMSGCIINDSIMLVVDPLPNLTVEAWADNDTIVQGTSTGLHVLPDGYNYLWTPSSGLNDATAQNPFATPNETISYSVVIDNGECAKSANVKIVVYEYVCGEPDLYIPNAFTPNGDGNNDKLFVRGNNITDLLLRIYDRWGELVFETYDQSIGWDGTFKGKESDPAVFDYYVEITCLEGQTYFKKGNITLIR